MRKRHENKLGMYLRVYDLLESNSDITSSIPALANTINEFKSSIDEIRAASEEASTASAGKTKAKSQSKKELIDALIPVGAGLNVFAKVQKDDNLMAIAKFKKTNFRNLRDTEIANRAETLYQKAIEKAAEIQNYGVTQEQIDTLAAKIQAYKDSFSDKEAAELERKEAHKSLQELFAEADSTLKEFIDVMIETKKEVAPEFYGQYQEARKIKDL